MRLIEREADDFASNLLMPGDRLREWISNRRIDLHVLSAIAKRFQVSFEALCIRFIKFTPQRAILVYWDNGYAKYEWRSSSAVRTRARIRRSGDPQEPLPGTLAADASVEQAWDGVEMSAAIWCPEEAPYMKLREFKHSYASRDRVLTLLLLESPSRAPGIGPGRTAKATTAMTGSSRQASTRCDDAGRRSPRIPARTRYAKSLDS
ncbi:MAG: hypothetical protein KatS3mg122_2094 [Caldimonas sp.]|nr:MAG: hypothetical protein KatS3mg122_2094 [Caldimonas sp.]